MSGSRPSPDLVPRPRPLSRRGRTVLIVVLAVLAVLYAAVVAFYNAEGGSTDVGGASQGSGPGDQGALMVSIAPVAIDAGTNQATVDLAFTSVGPGIVDDNGRLLNNVRVAVLSTVGAQEAKFPAGEPLGRFEAKIGLDGEQAYYPFDDHLGVFAVSADTYSRASDGSLNSTGDIPLGLQATGSVSGWDVTTDYPEQYVAGPAGSMGFTRSFSTRAFVFVMLFLAILLSAASLVVGILTFTNRRRAEVALLSWAAAVLFALPLLRTYFPNSPPVGASVDIYVYLWVIVAAVIAAALVVVAWIRQNAATLAAHYEAEIEDRNAT